MQPQVRSDEQFAHTCLCDCLRSCVQCVSEDTRNPFSLFDLCRVRCGLGADPAFVRAPVVLRLCFVALLRVPVFPCCSDKSIIMWNLTREDGDKYGVAQKRLTGHSHYVQDVAISSVRKHSQIALATA